MDAISSDSDVVMADVAIEDASVSAGETVPVAAEDALLAEQQGEDIELGPLVRMRLSRTAAPDPAEVSIESAAVTTLIAQWETLEVHNGVVYRRWSPKNIRRELLQLLVPVAQCRDFIAKAHFGMTGGHFGIRRTMLQVHRRAFWPGWRADVCRFCQQCQRCQTYYRGQLPRSGPLQPLLAGAPFEKLHIDITGPHPRTRSVHSNVY